MIGGLGQERCRFLINRSYVFLLFSYLGPNSPKGKMDRLNISEIFIGLSGECRTKGTPTLFIRLGGCNLNCRYCDTLYAKQNYETILLVELYNKIKEMTNNFSYPNHIIITGGEPLLQSDAVVRLCDLINPLCSIEIETNGSIPISDIRNKIEHPFLTFTINYKLPSSGEEDKMYKDNFKEIEIGDQIKFVVFNKEDLIRMAEVYETLVDDLKPFDVRLRNIFWVLPLKKDKNFWRLLENFILLNKLQINLSIQQHKIIWDNKKKKNN